MTAVNDVPSISSIVNQTVEANTATLAIPFTVADVETPRDGAGGEWQFQPIRRWLPNANVLVGGSGANRTVTVTPVAGPVGHVDDHADGE